MLICILTQQQTKTLESKPQKWEHISFEKIVSDLQLQNLMVIVRKELQEKLTSLTAVFKNRKIDVQPLALMTLSSRCS